MKQAVAHLIPFIEAEKERSGDLKPKGKIVVATVKGDVPRHRQEHRRRGAPVQQLRRSSIWA